MTLRNLSAQNCPVCNRPRILKVLEIVQVPVMCNVLWSNRENAQNVNRSDIQLGFCCNCGHLFNYGFDSVHLDYTTRYENSLHHSPRFQSYATALAHRLIDDYNLYRKTIVEIGTGSGDFLEMLCKWGGNRGFGFDPSNESNSFDGSDNITIVKDYYSDQYSNIDADFVCCRHVLEHISTPGEFLKLVRGPDYGNNRRIFFFEVPNGNFTLKTFAIWDIIYEHYSYFTRQSLKRLFLSNGFSILNVAMGFGGQFLMIETVPDPEGFDRTLLQEVELDHLQQMVEDFSENYRKKVRNWERRLKIARELGKRLIVWGVGSKGISFLNTLSNSDVIEYVVDLNPRKQGHFVTGTGQQIVAPDFLIKYKPDQVIIMNPVYDKEIRNQISGLGLNPEFVIA